MAGTRLATSSIATIGGVSSDSGRPCSVMMK
jgi:hypothetical protein